VSVGTKFRRVGKPHCEIQCICFALLSAFSFTELFHEGRLWSYAISLRVRLAAVFLGITQVRALAQGEYPLQDKPRASLYDCHGRSAVGTERHRTSALEIA
jgi:hypothetical protein